MKKMILFFGIFLLLIIVFSILYDGRILERSNYKVVNEKGNLLPAELYKRGLGKKGLILVFRVKDLGPYSVLVLFPKHKIVGVPNGNSKSYIKINKRYAWQKKKNYSFFTIMFNGTSGNYNETVFEDKLIKNISFNDGNISFDAYGKLKKYAKKITIKK